LGSIGGADQAVAAEFDEKFVNGAGTEPVQRLDISPKSQIGDDLDLRSKAA
jgi:hypothetical protein